MFNVVVCNQILIQGRVQNVGFRYFTFKTARMLKLSGFVRNEMDGSVYIEVEGNESNVNEFIKEVRKGPSWARVDQVDVNICPVQNFSEFYVK